MKKRMLFGIIVIIGIFLVALYFLVFKAKKEKVFLDEFRGDGTKSRFLIEAADYSHRSTTNLGSWYEVDGKTHKFIEGPNGGIVAPTAKSGSQGNYMEVMGKDTINIVPINSYYHGPFLDYKVPVRKVGTYRLYLRWTGRDKDTDSVYAFILKPDGMLLKGAGVDSVDFFLYHGRTDWTWDNIGLRNVIRPPKDLRDADAVWMIPAPGIYTIRLALREKQIAVDALVFQTDSLPAPTE